MSKAGKRTAEWILVPVFALLFSTHLLAWDPAGTWGIEGRSDATLIITKVDDHYVVDAKSAYSKHKAIGYFQDNQLILAYVVLTENQSGFITLKRLDDNRMAQVSLNFEGAVVWTGVLVRK